MSIPSIFGRFGLDIPLGHFPLHTRSRVSLCDPGTCAILNAHLSARLSSMGKAGRRKRDDLAYEASTRPSMARAARV